MSDPAASSDTREHRSGFVSLVGRPNVGKSTLLNALTGARLAIVSDKPQTTRTAIQGVLTTPEAQVVFLDTPGIHKSDTLFNKRMMEAVRSALDERDLLLFVIDASLHVTEEDRQALDVLRNVTSPVFLVLNKIDRVRQKDRLLPLIEHYKELRDFAEYIPVSAASGSGLEELKRAILHALPEGPQYFPADYVTDQPERFLAAEILREKILAETRQEVPHSVAVLIDAWEEKKRLIRIAATIYVERTGQKAIIIGARGAMLKTIGTAAREEMERLLGRKVFLEMFVKVKREWREDPAFLNSIDWRAMTGESAAHSVEHEIEPEIES